MCSFLFHRQYHFINFILSFFSVINDPEGYIYMRPNVGGGLVFGGFDKEAKPIFHESTPKEFENGYYKPDYDQFCKLTFNVRLLGRCCISPFQTYSKTGMDSLEL